MNKNTSDKKIKIDQEQIKKLQSATNRLFLICDPKNESNNSETRSESAPRPSRPS